MLSSKPLKSLSTELLSELVPLPFDLLRSHHRASSGEICTGAETGEFLDSGFEIFDLLLEFGCLCGVDSSELVFEALEARFFALFVDVGFVDMLIFADFVE